MKILIVSSHIFGYINYAVMALKEMGHEVEVLYHGKPPLIFKYKNHSHHAISFVKKIFGYNTKKAERHKILERECGHKKYDQILMIHPQYLNEQTIKMLSKITNRFIVLLFDSLKKMPRQKPVLKYFDEIFSYEPIDCQSYGFKFLTNFIPFRVNDEPTNTVDFFNISSHDHRHDDLIKLAKYFTEHNYKFEFLLYSKKLNDNKYFKVLNKKIDIESLYKNIGRSKVLVDIQRKDQSGLSFRVFESLGYQKKLLTTNVAVRDYEFYNPNNILIIDPDSIKIPPDFLLTEYETLPRKIYEKFTAESWVKAIFDI